MKPLALLLSWSLVVACALRARAPADPPLVKDGDERLALGLDELRRAAPTSLDEFLKWRFPLRLNSTTTTVRGAARRAQFITSGDNIICYVAAATTTSGAWGAWGYDCRVSAPTLGPALAKRIAGTYVGDHIRYVAASSDSMVTVDDPDSSITGAFELLASPGNYIEIATGSCPPEMVPARAAAELLFRRHRIDLLRRLALGINPEATVYGIRALLDSPDLPRADRLLAERALEDEKDASVAEVSCFENKPPRDVPGMHSASGWAPAGDALRRMAPFKMP